MSPPIDIISLKVALYTILYIILFYSLRCVFVLLYCMVQRFKTEL